MKEIDDLIISLENYMIDPVNDLYLGEDTALEGVNMDIAKLIRADDVKNARQLIKEAKKLARKKEFDEANKLLRIAKGMVKKMKDKVESMPEPDSKKTKVLSWFTPLFSTLPASEIDSMIYTGNGWITTYKTHTDKYSRETNSSVKRRIQERFNLFLVNIDKYTEVYNKRKRDLKNRKK